MQEKLNISSIESELLVRQSDEDYARFDPQRITDALIRETGLDRGMAEQVASEVRQQIERSGVRALTAPLIRGLVEAKLLEHGLMQEYRAHSRLGVPVYDVDRIIQSGPGESAILHGPEGTSLALAEAIKREYAILNVFSDAVGKAHLDGDLHVENMGEVDRPTTMIGTVDFIKRHGIKLPGGFAGSRPAKRPEVLASHLVSYTAALQGYFSESLAWDSVNYAFAPMLIGMSEREIRQLAQALLFELAAPTVARGGQPVRCDLHLDWEAPPYLKDLSVVGANGEKFTATYGAVSEMARTFLRMILENILEGDGQGLSFIGPHPILHLTGRFFEDPGNRPFLDLIGRVLTERGGMTVALDRLDENDAAAAFSARYGVGTDKLQRSPESWQWRGAVFSSVAINLPRLGYLTGGDQVEVIEKLTDLLELAAQASLEKRVFIEKLLSRGEAGVLALLAMRPDKEPFLPLSWTSHALSPVGLAELARITTGESPDRSGESLEFMRRVTAHLHTEAERLSAKHKVRFVIGESRDLSAPHRLARLDVKKFGTSIGQFLGSGAIDDQSVFYTSSVKLPVDSQISSIDRIRTEGDIQSGIWGASTDIWLGVGLPSAEETGALITRAFHETKSPAIRISPEFTLCLVCRKVARGAHAACPACGAATVDGLALATNRFSRTSTWPQWKLAELAKRHRM
ncbi:MAG: anaerobic ribonucleoside-triphosphate reductase [Blastocatellales bacterium]